MTPDDARMTPDDARTMLAALKADENFIAQLDRKHPCHKTAVTLTMVLSAVVQGRIAAGTDVDSNSVTSDDAQAQIDKLKNSIKQLDKEHPDRYRAVIRIAELEESKVIAAARSERGASRPVKAAYDRFIEARWQRWEQKEHLFDQLTKRSERPLRQAVVDTLKAYVEPGNTEVFPNEIARSLLGEFEWLLMTGQYHPAWKILVTQRRRDTPDMVDDKKFAVLYIRACEEGLISGESNPRKTIADLCSVDISTVGRWVRKFREAPDVSPAAFNPTLEPRAKARRIEKWMRKSAEHFRLWKQRSNPKVWALDREKQ